MIDMSTIDLTPVVQVVIAVVCAIVTKKLIPWLKANTNEKQQHALMTATTIAIFAAEQIYGAGKGSEKLQYAVDYLEQRGFTADVAVIEAAIRENIEKLHTAKPASTNPDAL